MRIEVGLKTEWRNEDKGLHEPKGRKIKGVRKVQIKPIELNQSTCIIMEVSLYNRTLAIKFDWFQLTKNLQYKSLIPKAVGKPLNIRKEG